ncbi:PR domain zinc finger protein 8 [Alosa sapidissima]|uniref:PR domain zinc finger protein 8 n=1 Tax=Alosa sapidissima TaxID=34773 RepID=UPI001C097A8F|nr:PR domain zinc finger protein 8 [Alosa sapidissima]
MDGTKLMRKADSYAADRWITDMLTSVFTKTDIPVNTVFGPCDLNHSSLYDSIAFIALKCSDRRTTPYMLKVDMSSASSESPYCLQLVQSARDAEEQNLEAYVKDGQLFFRALRTIQQDSELLAWYKKDLSQLLSLISTESKGVPPYMCPFCKQGFQFEFPLLAHQRFLCKERFLSLTSDRVSKESLHSKGDKPATDFHNLARDLENGRAPSNKMEKGGHTKRKHSEMKGEGRDEHLSSSALQGDQSVKRACIQRTTAQLCIPVPHRQTILGNTSTVRSAFESQPSSKESAHGKNVMGSEGLTQLNCKPKKELIEASTPSSHSDASSTNSSIHSGEEERKSAFVQPPRSFPQTHPMVMPLPVGLPQLPISASKLQSTVLLQASMHRQGSLLLNASRAWPKPLAPTPVLRKSAGAPRSLLSYPLSPLSPLGLPAQNWCAKCSISFHMTSDLVHHMRSHHKRAPFEEQGARQKREDRLRCHICQESFRERHHLSRHMTSHT